MIDNNDKNPTISITIMDSNEYEKMIINGQSLFTFNLFMPEFKKLIIERHCTKQHISYLIDCVKKQYIEEKNRYIEISTPYLKSITELQDKIKQQQEDDEKQRQQEQQRQREQQLQQEQEQQLRQEQLQSLPQDNSKYDTLKKEYEDFKCMTSELTKRRTTQHAMIVNDLNQQIDNLNERIQVSDIEMIKKRVKFYSDSSKKDIDTILYENKAMYTKISQMSESISQHVLKEFKSLTDLLNNGVLQTELSKATIDEQYMDIKNLLNQK
jgi:hypothetical protein